MFLVNKEKFKLTILDIAIVVVSIFFVIGINFWFNGCENENMSCHQAEKMITTLAIVMLIVAILKVACPIKNYKIGMSFTNVVLSIVTTLVPTLIINLCGMDSMRCNKYMKPYTIAFSLVILVLSLVDILFLFLSQKKDK